MLLAHVPGQNREAGVVVLGIGGGALCRGWGLMLGAGLDERHLGQGTGHSGCGLGRGRRLGPRPTRAAKMNPG